MVVSGISVIEIDSFLQPPPEGYVVIVGVGIVGIDCVERSLAKDIFKKVRCFNRAKDIRISLDGVNFLCPSFVDEIFRLFKEDHPDNKIKFFEASEKLKANTPDMVLHKIGAI